MRAHLDKGENEQAAVLVIDELGPDVLDYLRAYLDEDDSEDALSQWRTSVWKDLVRFRWECSLRTWAYKLAKHALSHLIRKPHRRREEHLHTSAASRLAGSIGASGAMTNERHQKLARLRSLLEPEEKELLVLRIDRELEWEEIADILDLSAVALRKRFERLVKKLQQLATDEGLLD